MNLIRLLRFAPTLVILGVLIYSAEAINETMASRPTAAAVEAPEAVLARLGLAAATEGAGDAEVDVPSVRKLRDPFYQPAKPEPARGPAATRTPTPEDRYAAFLDRAVLNATYIESRIRYAVINGRLYKQGDAVAGTGSDGAALVVHAVKPHEVVLDAAGKRYTLGYSDRLGDAMSAGGERGGSVRRGRAVDRAAAPGPDPRLDLIQALLGSQLGAVGSSLTNVLGFPQIPRGRGVGRP